MKFFSINSLSGHSARPPGAAGFTIPEFMVTLAVTLLVMGGVTATHLFGMRMYQLTRSKLGANDEARAAISGMIGEIRSAKLLRIGNLVNATNFTEITPNTPQLGSAIRIFPTTNMGQFIHYYWDGADKRIKRATNGSGAFSVVASSVSNQMVFSAEDYAGNILTNNDNNRVIGLAMQFYQLQYPSVAIGPGSMYDFYQLRTKITRRTVGSP